MRGSPALYVRSFQVTNFIKKAIQVYLHDRFCPVWFTVMGEERPMNDQQYKCNLFHALQNFLEYYIPINDTLINCKIGISLQ